MITDMATRGTRRDESLDHRSNRWGWGHVTVAHSPYTRKPNLPIFPSWSFGWTPVSAVAMAIKKSLAIAAASEINRRRRVRSPASSRVRTLPTSRLFNVAITLLTDSHTRHTQHAECLQQVFGKLQAWQSVCKRPQPRMCIVRRAFFHSAADSVAALC